MRDYQRRETEENSRQMENQRECLQGKNGQMENQSEFPQGKREKTGQIENQRECLQEKNGQLETQHSFQQRKYRTREDYADLYDLERPKSKHPPLSQNDRAAQFGAFVALNGHEEALLQTEQEVEDRVAHEIECDPDYE